MLRKLSIKITLFYVLSVVFIALNLWFIVKNNSFVISLLPVVFLLFLFVIFSFDKILYFVIFSVPLSLSLSEIMPGLSFNMFLPSEPLLFGLLLLFVLKLFQERGFDKKILLHPVSIAIYINIGWIFFTCFTSTMPIVSFKATLSRIWFVAGFYFLALQLFKNKFDYEKYIWLYTVPLAIVIFYATIRHLEYGLWDKQAAHFVSTPFYNDHTAYGAVLAIYIPFLAMFSFSGFYTKKARMISSVFLGIVLMGFILSYSRAAWISFVVALGIYVVIKLQIKFRTILLGLVSILVLFFMFENQILMKLEKNNEQSSANMIKHISSVSNITTDASNLERINRWSCAIRMFEDKPWFGFGPGTYMFQYAPYQLTKDRTIISTNSADGGNAHSEYLNPLAESGILGMVTFVFLLGVVIYTALHAYKNAKDRRLKSLVLASLISLFTYYVHGFLNNFLDTDKLSVPFWGFTAIIVSIDIAVRNSSTEPDPVKAENSNC